jgi:predicted acylesterase/phospholipase RssA
VDNQVRSPWHTEFLEFAMKKIGLALSGGGFRATLYHLGLVRFLRDADLLHQVTHITSVSGGSIMAAHLVLNWDRYTGSPQEFDRAAAQLLDFIRMDVRNRILRRYPLGLFLRWPRLLLGLSNRQLTRTGLLESQYEKHLYGDKSLLELPESPELHILTTNLSEGCLCSFGRDGLWMMQQKAGRSQIVRVRVGLMTVSMAVAASSAFPGFFPPLELTGREVGARGGEFGQQAYTDGAVFDNLGVRMFRWLTPLLSEDKSLDGVLVSDVGRPLVVQANRRAGGLIRTAMRAADILTDRVWQLENDNFEDTFGYVFARITDVASPHEDATALHPEVQRQTATIRTDLDAFSDLEISCLIRHGYCIGRKACRSRGDLFGKELPASPPWDPVPSARVPFNAPPAVRSDGTNQGSAPPTAGTNQDTAPSTIQARMLQNSSTRKIWGNLLSFRDWTSYIYVPLLFSLLIVLPYLVIQSYLSSRRVDHLVESLAHGNPDIDILTRLMVGPVAPFKGESSEEVRSLEPPNYKGFSVFQDSRILDLRQWKPSDSASPVYGYRHLKVQKNSDNTGNDVFRVVALTTHTDAQFRFPPSHHQRGLRRVCTENSKTQEGSCQFEVNIDLSKVPNGQVVDLIYEYHSRGDYLQGDEHSTTVVFRSEVDVPEVTRWFLLPGGREYRSYQIVRYETGKPRTAEVVKPLTDYMPDDPSIIAFKMVSVRAGYTFELTWFYK